MIWAPLASFLSLWLGTASAQSADEPSPGAQTFAVYCASCHGAEGMGDGPVGKMLSPRPARFADPGFWASRSDERITQVILEGGASVGASPMMAGFEGRLTPEQVAELVGWLRQRFAPLPAPAAQAPKAPDDASSEPSAPATEADEEGPS